MITETRFARFTSIRRVFTHPSSFRTSVAGESSIPSVATTERECNICEGSRDEVEDSRVSHSFRNAIWYFEYFSRVEITLLTEVALATFARARFKTFTCTFSVRCPRNLTRAICSSWNTRGRERTSDYTSPCESLCRLCCAIFDAILAYGKASLLSTERNNTRSKFYLSSPVSFSGRF